MKELLFALSRADGVAGQRGAAKVILGLLPACARGEIDPLGGVRAVMGEGETTILLAAHLDQVGLTVTHITKEGFLQAAKTGSPDVRALPGNLLTVHGKRAVPAVVCATPPHLSKKDEPFPSFDQLYLDTGLPAEEVKRLIFPGDRVTYDMDPAELENGLCTGRSFDDRAGCAVLLETAKRLANEKLPCRVVFAFTAMEELGCQGAKIAGFAEQPDQALAVDVSFGDYEGVPAHQCGKLGEGPMIGVAPVLDRGITQRLIALAKRDKLPYQLEGMGGKTSTDADAITVAGRGVPSGLVSIPLRNMHSPVEVLDEKDLESCCRLFCAYLLEGGRRCD